MVAEMVYRLSGVWEPPSDRTPPVWDGRRDGSGVECARAGGRRCSCFNSVKNVRLKMFLECWIEYVFFKDRRLWRLATVVEGSEGAWLWVEGGCVVSSLQQRGQGSMSE
jgi:hypothetical protein